MPRVADPVIHIIAKEKRKKIRSCHMVPKVVIYWPFEARKMKGIWKNQSWERAPQEGIRGEETFMESIVYSVIIIFSPNEEL